MSMACAAFTSSVGDYHIDSEPQLGAGSDATVYRALNNRTNEMVAVKVIDISNPRKRERALYEASIHRQLLRHEHIIHLYDVIEANGYMYFFLEYAPKGHLGAYVHRFGRLDESEAREYFIQILSALEHCHNNFVSHHDIKLENIMMLNNNTIRLIDFGLSKRFHESKIDEFSGSPLYMSPEILSLKPHDERVDIWSLGVCLYFMVTDIFPFPASTFHELEEKVLLEDFDFPKNMNLSENLKDLVRSMLIKDPEKRITLENIKKHSWLLGSRRCMINLKSQDQRSYREDIPIVSGLHETIE